MTRLETLKNRLVNEFVLNKNAKLADFRDLCAEIFEEMGGESELKTSKRFVLKERAKGLDCDVEKLWEMNDKIDEMEKYKNWARA